MNRLDTLQNMYRNAKPSDRLDADEEIYFGTELTYIFQKTFDKLYPEIMARACLPLDYSAGPGAETIRWYQFAILGLAKIVHNYAKDFPKVSVKGKRFDSPIYSLGASYAYTIQDIRAAMMVGRSLVERESNSARRAMLVEENRIAWFGDEDTGLDGIISNANVPNNIVTADGSGASPLWSKKSADQIIRDVNQAIATMVDLTKGVEVPNTCLLPVFQYQMIASMPRSTISDTTVLKFLKDNHPGIEFSYLPWELKGTGTGSSDQFLLYRRDPDKLALQVPQEYEQFSPTQEGLEFSIPVHQRCGGMIIHYPLSLSKSYGI